MEHGMLRGHTVGGGVACRARTDLNAIRQGSSPDKCSEHRNTRGIRGVEWEVGRSTGDRHRTLPRNSPGDTLKEKTNSERFGACTGESEGVGRAKATRRMSPANLVSATIVIRDLGWGSNLHSLSHIINERQAGLPPTRRPHQSQQA